MSRSTLRLSARAKVHLAPIQGRGNVTETTPFVATGQNQEHAGQRAHVIKGLLYALQNFYAFMLM